ERSREGRTCAGCFLIKTDHLPDGREASESKIRTTGRNRALNTACTAGPRPRQLLRIRLFNQIVHSRLTAHAKWVTPFVGDWFRSSGSVCSENLHGSMNCATVKASL